MIAVNVTSALFYTDEDRDRARAATPLLCRIGEPDDSAHAIVGLLRPEASYITGQDIRIDGGLDTVLMPAVRTASTR